MDGGTDANLGAVRCWASARRRCYARKGSLSGGDMAVESWRGWAVESWRGCAVAVVCGVEAGE